MVFAIPSYQPFRESDIVPTRHTAHDVIHYSAAESDETARGRDMSKPKRWYDDERIADVFAPPPAWPAAKIAAWEAPTPTEHEPLIVIDNQAGDDWIASARAEYDVTEEVGA